MKFLLVFFLENWLKFKIKFFNFAQKFRVRKYYAQQTKTDLQKAKLKDSGVLRLFLKVKVD